MAIDLFKTRLPKGKLKKKSLQIVYRSIWNHPFLVVMLFLFICLQRHFPFLFSFLVSASPILVCTAVLLATLLIHGQYNDHKARETSEVNTSKTASSEPTSPSVEKEGYFKDRFAEVRKDIVEKGMKAYFTEFEDKEAKMRKFQAKNIDRMARAYNDQGGRLDYTSLDQQKQLDYGTDHGSTDIESDDAEGSFLDALVSEAIPTPQETRPLLDSRDHPPHPGPSQSVSPKSEDVGSEDVYDDEEEEEEEEEQDNGLDVEKDRGEPVTMWTEEDEKNLRYLGTSELERNQCLENLIARRRHQRTFSTISDRSFMAFDRSDIPTFQVTPLTTAHKLNPFDVPDSTNPGSAPSRPLPRKNPFDSPSTSPRSERHKLNPFDVPNNTQDLTRKESVFRRYESFNPGYSFVGDGSGSRQDFMLIDKRDGLLPRHESFTSRSTFPSLFTLDKPTDGFHMKPVFAPAEAQHANSMDRQSVHDSESIASSGSDAESSVAPTNHEPEVTSQHHQDGEGANVVNCSPQKGHEEHQKGQTDDHEKKGKLDHSEHHSSLSSTASLEAGDKATSTSQGEGDKVGEPNSLPQNSIEESNAKNSSNDEGQIPKEPIYDTSPSCVDKNKAFS